MKASPTGRSAPVALTATTDDQSAVPRWYYLPNPAWFTPAQGGSLSAQVEGSCDAANALVGIYRGLNASYVLDHCRRNNDADNSYQAVRADLAAWFDK